MIHVEFHAVIVDVAVCYALITMQLKEFIKFFLTRKQLSRPSYVREHTVFVHIYGGGLIFITSMFLL